MRSRIVSTLLAIHAAVLLILTLGMFKADHPAHNFTPFRSIRHDWSQGGSSLLVNFIGNLVIFMPMGVLLALRWPRVMRGPGVMAACLVFSTSIEFFQYRSGRRVADIDDVILNILGGISGYLLLRLSRFRAYCRLPRMLPSG